MSTMTQDEKGRLIDEAYKLRISGDEEGAEAIYKTIPVPASYVKRIKESFGPDVLKRIGYNYSEAEELYGKDWLDR